MREVTIIGVPYNSAGQANGVARAPAALRAGGLAEGLSDTGDVDLEAMTPRRDRSGVIDEAALASMVSRVGKTVTATLASGSTPVVLGGDCPVLLGCLHGARRQLGPTGLVFMDGHEDAWPPRLSPTGEAADMELGFALGINTGGLRREVASLLPMLDLPDVVLIGPRDRDDIRDLGATSLADIVELHPWTELAGRHQELASHAARTLHERLGSWWLHVDLDVLSTEALPAVDYPQDGGMSWEELEEATAAAMAVPGCVGWDVTIYNPDMDPLGVHVPRIVSYVKAGAERLRKAVP